MLKRLPTALVICTLATPAFGQGAKYTITDLGPIAGTGRSNGRNVNNESQVIGKSTDFADENATTFWLPAPDFGMPAGPNAIPELSDGVPHGLSDAGHVTGFLWGTTTTYTPYVWHPTTGMLDLGPLGATNGQGEAVNSTGHVVGHMDGLVYRDAFLWDGSQLVTLPRLDDGGFQTIAEDINELSQITGYSTYPRPDGNPDGWLHATLWLPEPAYGLPAGIHDIDDLSEFNDDYDQYSVAKAINDLGQVAIWGTRRGWDGFLYLRFYLWLPEPDYGLPAGLNDLGFVNEAFGGTPYAEAINNRGEIAFRGNWDPSSFICDCRATLWRQGEWIDLNTQIPAADQQNWFLDAARDINDLGQITGEGYYQGEARGFLLTPIVEATTDCTADITGPGGDADGTVDALDYLLMIKQWGDCPDCEADITGPDDGPDGVVDALDFLALNSQWGDCADTGAMGACCFALTGDCQQLSAADCAFMDGAFTRRRDLQQHDLPRRHPPRCLLPLPGDRVHPGQRVVLLALRRVRLAGTRHRLRHRHLPRPPHRRLDPRAVRHRRALLAQRQHQRLHGPPRRAVSGLRGSQGRRLRLHAGQQ